MLTQNEINIIRYCRDFLYIKDEHLADFFDDLSLKNYCLKTFTFFNTKKNFCFENFFQKFNFDIISLGYDCLPYTYSIWYGLKLPRYISHEPRLFFDMAQTDAEFISFFLNTNSYIDFSLDIYNKFFFSKKFNLLFNHDLASNYNYDKEKFSFILNNRLNLIKKKLLQGNKLCILHVRKNIDYKLIESIIKSYNNSNNLILINELHGLNKIINDNNVLNIKLPYLNFKWHDKKNINKLCLRSFENHIINFIKKSIIKFFNNIYIYRSIFLYK